MIFKKINGQIFGVELTKKEQKAMDVEINQQIIATQKQYVDDFDYTIMKILHDHFGFGLTRLRRFYEVFTQDYNTLEKHYEMGDAGTYIARKEMNAIGCNIEKWNQERSD